MARLTYVQKVDLTAMGNNQAALWFFRANSIFDPDATGLSGGGQPYGRDTYASIYNHYQVMSSIITVSSNTLANPDFMGVGIIMDDDASVTASKRSAKELCSRKGSTFRTWNKGGMNHVISRKFDTKYFVNKNGQQTSMGANAPDGYYFGIFNMCDEVSNTLNCVVTITYTCKFWELRELSAQ